LTNIWTKAATGWTKAGRKLNNNTTSTSNEIYLIKYYFFSHLGSLIFQLKHQFGMG